MIERAVIMAGEGEIHLGHIPGASARAPREATPPSDSDNVLQMPVGARMEEVEEAYLRLTLKYTATTRHGRRKFWEFPSARSTTGSARTVKGKHGAQASPEAHAAID